MLKRRLCLLLPVYRGELYRTKRFRADRRYPVEFVDLEGADELLVVDVTPDLSGRDGFFRFFRALSERLFVPLCAGGHVRTVEDALGLLRAGADKVIVGTHAWSDLGLVEACARKLGSQSVVAAIDVKDGLTSPRGAGLWVADGVDPALAALGMQTRGAGELLVNSIDRDGSLEGYDVDVVRDVASVVTVPVIAAGGCGEPRHMVEAFRAGAEACATSNVFHWTGAHIARFKAVCAGAGIAMRLEDERHGVAHVPLGGASDVRPAVG